jgi:putative hemolysin
MSDPNTVHIRKHEAVPDCGSFKVWYSDGRLSRYFYWDDVPSRRLRPDLLDRETALTRAKEFARAERDRLCVL